MRQTMFVVFLLCLAAAATFVVLTTQSLPDPVATHFGADNRADGWMTRDGYRRVMLAFLLVFPAVIVALTGWLPRMFPRLTKLPHREYWFAPRRRAATLGFLYRHGCRLGCMMIFMVAGMHYAIVVAHRREPPVLPLAIFLPLLGLFAFGFVAWVSALTRRFRRPHERYSSGMGLPMA